jgi:hypothetical protein
MSKAGLRRHELGLGLRTFQRERADHGNFGFALGGNAHAAAKPVIAAAHAKRGVMTRTVGHT